MTRSAKVGRSMGFDANASGVGRRHAADRGLEVQAERGLVVAGRDG